MNNQQAPSTRQHWENRYAEGVLPWDSGITPPEVESFWQSDMIPTDQRQRRLAVDFGCGTGTNAAYLSGLGMRAIGVELASRAIVMAHQRIKKLPLEQRERMAFVQASVSDLPFTGLGACYILDIGCFHTVPLEERRHYAQGVIDNLASGGYYHLYGFDWMAERENDPNKSPRGLRDTEVVDLLTPHLDVVEIVQAQPNPHPCRWYLLRKGDGG